MPYLQPNPSATDALWQRAEAKICTNTLSGGVRFQMIHQLVYYSRNVVPGNDRALLTNLREIVSASQRNNSQNGVAGFLIFDKTWFLQILEGSQAQVSATYNRISRDIRHSSPTIMDARNVHDRCFPNWTMGGATRTPEVEEIYLQHGIGSAIEPNRLKSVQVIKLAQDLQAFDQAKRQGLRMAS